MLHRHRHGLRILIFSTLELGVLTAAFFLTYWIRQATDAWWLQPLGGLEKVLWIWPVALTLWSALLWSFNTYQGFRSRPLIQHGFLLGVVSVLGMLGLFALVTITREFLTNRSFIGLFGVISFLMLFSLRTAITALLLHYTQKGYDRHYVLIGGTHEEARALARSLEGIPGAVYEVRGFVSEDPAEVGRSLDRWKILGTFEQIPKLATAEPVDDVYLLPRQGTLEAQRAVVEQCESMGLNIHVRLVSFERMVSRPGVHEAGGAPYLSFVSSPRVGAPLVLKRMVDLAGALGMLVLLSPLLLVVAVLVRLSSRGPAVFRQERAGMSGRAFTLYKFRTMREGAEKERDALQAKNEMAGPVFKIRDDPRVTPLGRLLRRTSIDELPQLWNVLKGDMSLVGPRPLPLYEVEKFERWQRRRMTMRPGITCLWQVAGRNKVTSFAEWMKMDLDYVDRWSLGLDLKILVKTIPAVLGGRGAY